MITQMRSCAKERFTFEWDHFYFTHNLNPVDNPITLSTWVVTGATSSSESVVASDTSIKIEGGVKGEFISIVNSIEIGNGEFKDCFELLIEVK